jgi:SAM-dependent methyltransferase
MTLSEAIDLIRPATGAPAGTWADFGAGRGLFSRALLRLLGDGGRVIAVDRDPEAVRALARQAGPDAGRLSASVGDFRDLGRIDALDGVHLDGALFANALHFIREPAVVLARLSERLRPGARVVVIEYERGTANRWVPHPLPPALLRTVAERAGYGPPRVVARRPSAYQGGMYCAVMSWPPEAPESR